MLKNELMIQVKQLAEQATEKAGEYTGLIGPIKELIVEHFGQVGLTAAYLILAVLVVFVASRIAKLTFATLKYLVLPAIGLAFIGSMFLPYSFAALLPMTATGCSLFLLIKG